MQLQELFFLVDPLRSHFPPIVQGIDVLLNLGWKRSGKISLDCAIVPSVVGALSHVVRDDLHVSAIDRHLAEAIRLHAFAEPQDDIVEEQLLDGAFPRHAEVSVYVARFPTISLVVVSLTQPIFNH